MFCSVGVTSIIPSWCHQINCYVRNCGYTIWTKCIVPITRNDYNLLPPWTNALCRVRIFHRRARKLDVILEPPLWTVWNPDINKGFSIGLFGEEWCLGHNSKPMSCFVSPSLSILLPFFSESSPFTTTPPPTPLGDVTDAISSDKDTYFRYYDANRALLVSTLQHGGGSYLLIICKWPRSTCQQEVSLRLY